MQCVLPKVRGLLEDIDILFERVDVDVVDETVVSRPAVKRDPRDVRIYDQYAICLFEPVILAHSVAESHEVMVRPREVDDARAREVDGDADRLGELDERVDRFGVPPRVARDDQRPLGVHERCPDLERRKWTERAPLYWLPLFHPAFGSKTIELLGRGRGVEMLLHRFAPGIQIDRTLRL